MGPIILAFFLSTMGAAIVYASLPAEPWVSQNRTAAVPIAIDAVPSDITASIPRRAPVAETASLDAMIFDNSQPPAALSQGSVNPASYSGFFDPVPVLEMEVVPAWSVPRDPHFQSASPDILTEAEPAPAIVPPQMAMVTPVPIAVPAIPQLVEGVPLPAPRPSELQVLTGQGQVRQPTPRIASRGKGSLAPPNQPDNRSFIEKLFGLAKPSGATLAYATPDDGIFGNSRRLTGGSTSRSPDGTAVYDIAAHTVYMPDGSHLEAHSGLGDRLDDPAHVYERMRGATPPAVYDLQLRESLFHGVQALRLNPVGGGTVFGRTGLLAHTFMLGPNGDSNGCVSFRDYKAFLRAYLNGDVKRLVVVARQT